MVQYLVCAHVHVYKRKCRDCAPAVGNGRHAKMLLSCL